jgi:hypothetical protein
MHKCRTATWFVTLCIRATFKLWVTFNHCFVCCRLGYPFPHFDLWIQKTHHLTPFLYAPLQFGLSPGGRWVKVLKYFFTVSLFLSPLGLHLSTPFCLLCSVLSSWCVSALFFMFALYVFSVFSFLCHRLLASIMTESSHCFCTYNRNSVHRLVALL